MAKITNISWCDSTFNPFIASNVVPACKSCNSAKGDKSAEEFMTGRGSCG